MISNKETQKDSHLITLLALSFVLLINGAIPFFAIPTFGQALWASGFAQSIANSSSISIYANDIGYPYPASIAFGLSGVLPIATLIKIGLPPPDAYSTVVAVWLAISFYACKSFCRALGLSNKKSLALALLWATQPIIWAHQDYSMLASGIALLSLYLYSAFRLFDIPGDTAGKRAFTFLLYPFSCALAIFMDGYTFMMFAVGSSLIGASAMLAKEKRRYLITQAYPTHVISFSVAYLLYALYIGKGQYEASSLDFFRGWGADLIYFAVPTEGTHWLWDLLNLSTARTEANLFGDASVWQTTFLLPTLLLAILSGILSKSKHRLLAPVICTALFSAYMSLGPGLKINTEKNGVSGVEMPAHASVIDTGSALISENVPGFKNMRASYRWAALTVFSLWLITAIGLSNLKGRNQNIVVLFALAFAITSNLPHIQEKLERAESNRSNFSALEKELIIPLRTDVNSAKIIAFLPYRNDFIATYAAPLAGVKTYNIGGDKNVISAKEHWPTPMKMTHYDVIDSRLAAGAIELLATKQAEAVVLPHINFHHVFTPWPAPILYKDALTPIRERISRSGIIDQKITGLYTILKLRNDAEEEDKTPEGVLKNVCNSSYPVIASENNCALPFMLRDGWHQIEGGHIWSSEAANIRLFRPESCQDHCRIAMFLSTYGASPERPVNVHFRWKDEIKNISPIPSLSISDNNPVKMEFTLPSNAAYSDLEILIPNAISPNKLTGSLDTRTLGISLTRIEVAN